MSYEVVLELDHHRGNPRNSEGSFVTLNDGSILYAYSRYRGSSSSDHAPADIAARLSSDGGKSWTKRDRILVKNEGRMNVMSVSLLRLHDGRIALFYARKNSLHDCIPRLRTSSDEGKTWSGPTQCMPGPGYFVVNNDRVIQLRSGRLLIPASYHRAFRRQTDTRELSFDGRGIIHFFLSDDAGKTWREAQDWWALPVKPGTGLQEPGVVELKNGSLYCYCRTGTGRQWELRSRDGGNTWSPPEPSRFRSPCSPLSIKRIPATGDLLAVWNDYSPAGRHVTREAMKTAPKSAQPDVRTPLSIALSKNEGKTWSKGRVIEPDPLRGFCYTAIHFTDDAVLLAYCCGGLWKHKPQGKRLQDSCIRRISLDWLYGRG